MYHYIHITGDPGVGKSHYLIFDLLSTMIENYNVPDFKVVLIVSKKAFAYSHSSDWFDCHTVDDKFQKAGARRRYLPSWTLDEAKDAFIKMKNLGVFMYEKDDPCPVSEESIEIEFEMWGGIPRILYHRALDKYSPRLLMRALFDLRKEVIDKIQKRFQQHDRAGSKNENRLTEEDLPHILYHYYVDPHTFECDYDNRPVNEVIAGYIDWAINRRTIEEYTD